VKALALSKACEAEDFAHPDLVEARTEPWREDRDHWEVAMALRAFAHFDVLRPGSSVLGLCREPSDLAFHVAARTGALEVVPAAPLPYPDGSFDGAFWSRSVSASRLRDAAYAAAELGRALKRGGVLAVAADLRLAGPPGTTGWPGPLAFTAAHLSQFVVDASGLAVVDGGSWTVSDRTLATPRDLNLSTSEHHAAAAAPGDRYEPSPWGFPKLITVRDGYVCTSVHLTLVKR